MTKHADSGSVFTDDSGARRRLLIWSFRGAVAAIAVAAAGFVLTLVTHVPLPGLDEPLSVPGFGSSERRAADSANPNQAGAGAAPGQPAPTSGPTAVATDPTDATTPAGEAKSGGSQPAGSKPSTPANPTPTPVNPPSATPTPSRGSKANRGAASEDAPRADPTHVPGATDKTPPGKTK